MRCLALVPKCHPSDEDSHSEPCVMDSSTRAYGVPSWCRKPRSGALKEPVLLPYGCLSVFGRGEGGPWTWLSISDSRQLIYTCDIWLSRLGLVYVVVVGWRPVNHLLMTLSQTLGDSYIIDGISYRMLRRSTWFIHLSLSLSLSLSLCVFVCVGGIRGLAVACWTTDHYHPCSNLGVGISEGCFIFDKGGRKTPIIIVIITTPLSHSVCVCVCVIYQPSKISVKYPNDIWL